MIKGKDAYAIRDEMESDVAETARRAAKGQLKRDGEIVFQGTENDAMIYIHKNHCFSYYEAIKHQGFSYDTAKEVRMRLVMKTPTREEKLENAVKLVLALNQMSIDSCVRKIHRSEIAHCPEGYSISRYLVDLDPKAMEQLKEALV